MGNVRTVSFACATHHEATDSPSMAACARMRECKRPPAPGEVPVKMLSDGGSIPPTSTMILLTFSTVVLTVVNEDFQCFKGVLFIAPLLQLDMKPQC